MSSTTRLNKNKLVNFHPTGTNIVSGHNGGMFRGISLKRPTFYYPMQDTEAADPVYVTGGTTVLTDYSGFGNHGTIQDATGSGAAYTTFGHSDTPWSPRVRKGLHKVSMRINGDLRKKDPKDPGWGASYAYGTDSTHLRPATSLTLSMSNPDTDGSHVFTGKSEDAAFGSSYTFAIWLKPNRHLLENEYGQKSASGNPGWIVPIFTLRDSEYLALRLDTGQLEWAMNAAAAATQDVTMRTVSTNVLKADKWTHVVISRDRGNNKAPRIYVNGKRRELVNLEDNDVNSAGIPKPTAIGTPCYAFHWYSSEVGGHWGSISTVHVGATTGQRGYKDIRLFSGHAVDWIGWNVQLEERDIYNIYGASLLSYRVKSGFMDVIPPRVKLMIDANKTGSYPTLARTGDRDRRGIYKSQYDDRDTIIFTKHIDLFPGELDEIGKFFDEDDIKLWLRLQATSSIGIAQHQGTHYRGGQYPWHPIGINDPNNSGVVDSSNSSLTGTVYGLPASDGTGTAADGVADVHYGALVGSTVTGSEYPWKHNSRAKAGPFKSPSMEQVDMMSKGQLSRWGGRKSIVFPNVGSGSNASAYSAGIQVHDHTVDPKMTLVNLRNRDKPWTVSVWLRLEDTLHHEGHGDTFPAYKKHGIFMMWTGLSASHSINGTTQTGAGSDVARSLSGRDGTPSGCITRAYLQHKKVSKSLNKCKIIWRLYGKDNDDAVGDVLLQSPYFHTGSMMGGKWHHFAFVYKGGPTRPGQGHWVGRTRMRKLRRLPRMYRKYFRGANVNTAKHHMPPRGGRCKVYVDGQRIVMSGTLTNIGSFKRLIEPTKNRTPHEKGIVFGSLRVSGSVHAGTVMSGNISEVAFIQKSLRLADIRRIVRNGELSPSVNITEYPYKLNPGNKHLRFEPNGTIITYGSQAPGISDHRIRFTKGEGISPFNDENAITLSGSAMIGTPANVRPGLDQRLSSKTSFVVSVTPRHDNYITMYHHSVPSADSGGGNGTAGRGRQRVEGRSAGSYPAKTAGMIQHAADNGTLTAMAAVPLAGVIPAGDYTGFNYFNFRNGNWDQVGLYDVLAQTRIRFDPTVDRGWGASAASDTAAKKVNDYSVGAAGDTGTSGKKEQPYSTDAWITSGTFSFPMQFKPQPGNQWGQDYDETSDVMTGRPIMEHGAPYATKYHATSSCLLKLSDYISHPFLLEQVHISIPVVVHKAWGGDVISYTPYNLNGTDGAPSFITHAMAKEADNYAFFLYRQTRHVKKYFTRDQEERANATTAPGQTLDRLRPVTKPSPKEVSGSQRYLICSGVACFYNSIVWSGVRGEFRAFEPSHTPAFQHDWNANLRTGSFSSGTGSNDEFLKDLVSGSFFTGSIKLVMKPAVQGTTTYGNARYYSTDRQNQDVDSNATDGTQLEATIAVMNSDRDPYPAVLDRSGNVYLKTAWPGGTTFKNIFSGTQVGKTDFRQHFGHGRFLTNIEITETYTDYEGSAAGTDYYREVLSVSSSAGMNDVLRDTKVVDTRAGSAGGMVKSYNAAGVPQDIANDGVDRTQMLRPYLLYPEDELVFGVNFLPTLVSRHNGWLNEVTGSWMRLSSSSSATFTFYGSMLREDKPLSTMLNQNLTSDAVHEIIGAEPIVDQYMINERQDYSGSYIDNIVMGKGLRRNALAAGNLQKQWRARYSIVGKSSMTTFSGWHIVRQSGNEGRYDYKMVNTSMGFPNWGLKHTLGRARYILERETVVGAVDASGAQVYQYVVQDKGWRPEEGGNTSRPNWNGMYADSPNDVPYLQIRYNLFKPRAESLLRGVRLVTENERYYDSLIPNIIRWAKKHKGAVIKGKRNVDTKRWRRPAIGLPGQTNIARSQDQGKAGAAGIGRLQDPTATTEYAAGSAYDHGPSHEGSPKFFLGHDIWYPTWTDADGTGHGSINNRGEGQDGWNDLAPPVNRDPRCFEFEIEPCGRGIIFSPVSISGTAAGSATDGGDGGDPAIFTDGGTYITAIRAGTDYDTRGSGYHAATDIANCPDASVNSGIWSGSLMFPFEGNPGRTAKPQRTMLIVATSSGDSTTEFGEDHCRPHFAFQPKVVRTLLFRYGFQGHHYSPVRRDGSSRYKDESGNVTFFFGNEADSLGYRAILTLSTGSSDDNDTLRSMCYTRGNPKFKEGASGFRYGLINTEPMNTSAVFRHDHFGMLRDMLEQRQFTRFYKKPRPTRYRRFKIRRRSRRRSSSNVTSGPVTIRFVSSTTGRRIKPSHTYSQNLSRVASSSVPYFDEDRTGKYRNRGWPWDDSIIDSYISSDEDVD